MEDAAQVRLTIGDVAARLGIGVRTVRFWPDEGLVEPPARSAGGYRLYDAAAVARLDMVRTPRGLGLGLPAVRELLTAASPTSPPSTLARSTPKSACRGCAGRCCRPSSGGSRRCARHPEAVTWLLVHPPLLGPAVLGPLAAELRGRGADVAVPDLRGRVQDPASAAPSAAGWDRRWAAAVPPAEVVVGFSGAGIVLPAVAAACGARRAVWVDAVLPGPGTAHWPADVRDLVAPRTEHDGRVAEWTTWWGPDAMAALLPDDAVRAAVLAEGHRLPADLWRVGVAVPPLTADPRYVHLSAAYDADAAAARDRGWPVAGDGRGAHLDVATDPARVAGLLG